ncbi:male sterility protein [Xylariales sp. PMI_506]|nr:male sterility protein [Xylariales sp. PMI_506]
MEFFSDQIVFITGSTGALGACLLYKLAVRLKVPKIYALVRKSPSNAIQAWRAAMPDQIDEILQSGSLHFILGDITMPQFGIDKTVLEILENEVTIVINAAANISLKKGLREIVQTNCLSALQLANMATKFKTLRSFVQVSTAYVISDQVGGTIAEDIYPMVEDANQILDDILSGKSEDWSDFPWPYGKSKRLMEILMNEHFSQRLPLLIVRPSQIGPAIKEPYELYMPISASPMSGWSSQLMLPVGGTVLYKVENASKFGHNILDEIPVDLVANVILQHIQRGTRGVVHASSQLFFSRTFNQFLEHVRRAVPAEWRGKLPVVSCTTDPSAKESMLADLYRVHTRNYLFSTERSRHLDVEGPIGLDLRGFDMEDFTARRMRHIYSETAKALERKVTNNKIKRESDQVQAKI